MKVMYEFGSEVTFNGTIGEGVFLKGKRARVVGYGSCAIRAGMIKHLIEFENGQQMWAYSNELTNVSGIDESSFAE